MEAILTAIQESAFAAQVRDSTFIYPVANVTHVVTVIAFFGLVATMDLRLLRVFSGVPADRLVAFLRPLAMALFLIIVAAGFILFSAEAVPLARNAAFRMKAAAIALALVNVLLNDWSLRRFGEMSFVVRATAAISLLAWLFVAAMGRMIAYV